MAKQPATGLASDLAGPTNRSTPAEEAHALVACGYAPGEALIYAFGQVTAIPLNEMHAHGVTYRDLRAGADAIGERTKSSESLFASQAEVLGLPTDPAHKDRVTAQIVREIKRARPYERFAARTPARRYSAHARLVRRATRRARTRTTRGSPAGLGESEPPRAVIPEHFRSRPSATSESAPAEAPGTSERQSSEARR